MSGSRRSPGEYEVGYGRPPVQSRFKPGQSGNPRGRPRAKRNASTILKEIFNRKVIVRDGSGPRRVTLQEAMLLKFAENALKGDGKAAMLLLNLAERYSEDPAATIDVAALSQDDQALISDYLARAQDEAVSTGSAE